MNPSTPHQSVDARVLRDRRKALIEQTAGVFGLERAVMLGSIEDGVTLQLEFVVDRSDAKTGGVPPNLKPDNIELTCIEPVDAKPYRVVEIESGEKKNTVRLRLMPTQNDLVEQTGGLYRVAIHGVPELDPHFSWLEFAFGVQPPRSQPFETPNEPAKKRGLRPTSYLSKDGESIKQFMLERMRGTLPQWQERNPADIGVTIIEAVSHAADMLSYYQDAVGTEAYTDTARQRMSIRRHGRLVGIRPSDGTGARTWLTFEVDRSTQVPSGTRVGTVPIDRHQPGSPNRGDLVFRTAAPLSAHPEQNRMTPHGWGMSPVVLSKGTTTMTLKGHLQSLREGSLVFIVEGQGHSTSNRRHAVRLTRDGVLGLDKTTDTPITQVHWSKNDALPFDLHIHDGPNEASPTVAVGNGVLAQQGELLVIANENIAFRESSILVKLGGAGTLCFDKANTALAAADQRRTQATRAVPDVLVMQQRPDGRRVAWTSVPDLLSSSPVDRHFVVETTNKMDLSLRFGDGRSGMPMPSPRELSVLVNAGHGQAGNVGPDAMLCLHTTHPGLLSARNPMPATGGTAPDTLEEARMRVLRQTSDAHACVDPSDYADLAERHPHIRQADAQKTWSGTWPGMTVHLLSETGGSPSEDALHEVAALLNAHRRIGVRVDVHPAAVVHLDMEFRVVLSSDVPESTMRRRLMQALGAQSSNEIGLFHPDNWGLGQDVYEAPVVRCLADLPGVEWLDTVRFQRRDGSNHASHSGVISIQPHEVARIDTASIHIDLEVRDAQK